MARKMTDDEISDMTYNKLFGDLDDIRSGGMFESENEGLGALQEPASNAGEAGMAGIDISIKPIMAAAAEGGKPDDLNNGLEEEDDKLKGISKMSPLMAQLHGNR